MSEENSKYAKLAKALANDIATSIPRCYRMIFNDMAANNGSDRTVNAKPEGFEKTVMQICSGGLTAAFTATSASIGGIITGVTTIVLDAGASPVAMPLFLLSMIAGAPAFTPLCMKLYAAINNFGYDLSERITGKEYLRIEDEALPAFNKALLDINHPK